VCGTWCFGGSTFGCTVIVLDTALTPKQLSPVSPRYASREFSCGGVLGERSCGTWCFDRLFPRDPIGTHGRSLLPLQRHTPCRTGGRNFHSGPQQSSPSLTSSRHPKPSSETYNTPLSNINTKPVLNVTKFNLGVHTNHHTSNHSDPPKTLPPPSSPHAPPTQIPRKRKRRRKQNAWSSQRRAWKRQRLLLATITDRPRSSRQTDPIQRK
jgi:hypothetical protein